MDKNLAQILIEKNLLKEEMEITVKYYGLDLSGLNKVVVKNNFFINKLTQNQNNTILELRSTKDGTLIKATTDQIVDIEGMPPSRFAACYNIRITEDGSWSTNSNKKKRGRRPKIRFENLQTQQQV